VPDLALGDERIAIAMTDQAVGLPAPVEQLATGSALPVSVEVPEEQVTQLFLVELRRGAGRPL
jgi:hypothetical protein